MRNSAMKQTRRAWETSRHIRCVGTKNISVIKCISNISFRYVLAQFRLFFPLLRRILNFASIITFAIWLEDWLLICWRNISGRSEETTRGTCGEFLAMVMPVPHSPLEQPKPQVPLFPSWWYPKKWMVFMETPIKMEDLGASPPFQETWMDFNSADATIMGLRWFQWRTTSFCFMPLIPSSDYW